MIDKYKLLNWMLNGLQGMERMLLEWEQEFGELPKTEQYRLVDSAARLRKLCRAFIPATE